jgi:hypothetical protein
MKKTIKHKCECPKEAIGSSFSDMFGYEPEEEKARIHEANKCPGDYEVKHYLRKGKKLWLCSCCSMFGDIEIKL